MKKTILTMLTLAMTTMVSAQTINLPGVSNARQLGGYVIGDKTVKENTLIRSANLSEASDEALQTLHDTYHVAQVFDFRSTTERLPAPDRIIPGCEYHMLPCLEQAAQSVTPKQQGTQQTTPGAGNTDKMGEALFAQIDNPKVQMMADSLYSMILFDPEVQNHYSSFLHTLAALPEGKAALWHCSQGKDRAGCGSALLLAALGADRKLIVEDFARSNVSYQPLIDRLIQQAKDKGVAEYKWNVIYALVGVSVPNFERALDTINARWGSLDNYLTQALHVDATLRQALRERFLK